jgi:hypothetical protein
VHLGLSVGLIQAVRCATPCCLHALLLRVIMTRAVLSLQSTRSRYCGYFRVLGLLLGLNIPSVLVQWLAAGYILPALLIITHRQDIV